MQYDKLTRTELDKIGYLQPERWSDITEAFRFYLGNDFCNPVRISVVDKIIGIWNSILFEDTAWLDHIIVNKDFRNRGIGFQIVDYLLNDIRAKNFETNLLIAADLSEPVYKRAGFRKVSDYPYFNRENSVIASRLSDNIKSCHSDFYNDIIRLDISISVEYREKLVKKYLDKSFVYVDGNVVDRFYLPNLVKDHFLLKQLKLELN